MQKVYDIYLYSFFNIDIVLSVTASGWYFKNNFGILKCYFTSICNHYGLVCFHFIVEHA